MVNHRVAAVGAAARQSPPGTRSGPASSLPSHFRSRRHTEYSGIDAFPPLALSNRSRLITDAIRRKCGTIIELGRPAGRAGSISPGPDGLRRHRPSPYAFWLRAVAAPSLAYAEHRWNHFEINCGCSCQGELQPAPVNPSPTRELCFPPERVQSWVDRAALSVTDRLGLADLLARPGLGILAICRPPVAPTHPADQPLGDIVRAELRVDQRRIRSRYHLWTMSAPACRDPCGGDLRATPLACR